MNVGHLVLRNCNEMEELQDVIIHKGRLFEKGELTFDKQWEEIGINEDNNAFIHEEDMILISWLGLALWVYIFKDRNSFEKEVERFKVYYNQLENGIIEKPT